MGEGDKKNIEQVPRGPTDGNPISKAKGVSGDRKSEGRPRRSPGEDEQKLNSRPIEPGKRTMKRIIPTVSRRFKGKFSRSGRKCNVLPREICLTGQLSEVRASTEEILKDRSQQRA